MIVDENFPLMYREGMMSSFEDFKTFEISIYNIIVQEL